MLNTIQANNSSLIILSEMIEESQEIKPQELKHQPWLTQSQSMEMKTH